MPGKALSNAPTTARICGTTDTSRNNFWLAILTMGEGWHNNHHCFMNSVRQGFFWWEVDTTYYLLKALSWIGVTWDLIQPPARLLQREETTSLPTAAPSPALD